MSDVAALNRKLAPGIARKLSEPMREALLHAPRGYMSEQTRKALQRRGLLKMGSHRTELGEAVAEIVRG